MTALYWSIEYHNYEMQFLSNSLKQHLGKKKKGKLVYMC